MMTLDSSDDIAWLPAEPVAAAKLHVLQLGQIRDRLGPSWPRLSALVHQLFEKALAKAQGPRDYFISQGELCYIATFHGLSHEEARLACAAVAQDVCDLLFGEDHEMVSVRALVGMVPGPVHVLSPHGAQRIAAILEKSGRESVISRGMQTGAMAAAHVLARRLRQSIGFAPAWDLQKKKSQWLLLGLEGKTRHGVAVMGARRALGPCEEVAEMEIALLRAAADYALKLEEAGRFSAIAVGVFYESLQGIAGRMRYLDALKSLALPQSCPLLVKIDGIPAGTPLNRLGEVIAMLSVPGVRLLVKFEDARVLPQLDVRLGAAGLGALLPEHCAPEEARLLAQRLKARALEQKSFAFVEGVETRELAEAVSAVRFASGNGLGGAPHLTGLEAMPCLPLAMAAQEPCAA